MADVKWIKITTDIFDDEKILLIESLPEADSIIVIWFKLLCLAGKMNNSGVFMMNDRIPYTDQMLATIFRRKETTIKLALETFEKFGMIEIVNGVITIPNWDKHQSLDAYERKKERDRIYQADRRAKQKAITEKSSDKSSDSHTTQSSYVAPLEEDIDKDKDIYKDIDISLCPEPLQASEQKEATKTTPEITITLNTKEEYPIYQSDIDEWKELYPSVDIIQELRKMKGWCNANPSRRKTSRGIRRFINNWLAKEQDKGGNISAKRENGHWENGVYIKQQKDHADNDLNYLFEESAKRCKGGSQS